MSNPRMLLENISEENNETERYESNKESLLQQIRELRIKNDRLRLENQTLRTELYRFLDLRYLLPKTIKILKQEITNRILKIKKIVGKIKKIAVRKQTSEEKKPDESNFNPYKVQILQPIQNDRLRVLHVIANFYTGGSARLVVDLIEHLGHRFEQEVITRDYPTVPGYIGLSVHHYECFTHPRQVLSILEKFRPNFIHVHYLGHHKNNYSELDWKWYNNVFQAAQQYGCRIIENVNIPTDPYVSDAVSFYVYVSDYVSHEFGHIDSPNITVYPGSDLSVFSRKNRVNIPDDCIGMVYRLEGDKLNEHSISVFIKVVQRRPKTKVLIVGGGRYLELYQNLVQQAGVEEAFTFTGYVSYEDIPQLYEQMSIFVAPVHTESFGQVSPFAMGMEIPVVSYDVGGLKEIVGDSKLLAPPGDSDQLANIIIELLDDRERRIQIGQINRQRAQKLFSVEAMIESYSRLYNEMLKLSEVVPNA